MNTRDLFEFIINNDSIISKHNLTNNKTESYSIIAAEMPDENTLYIYGKKPNVKSKYAFIINPIFNYYQKDKNNIDILFNNRLEFTLRIA